MRRSAARAPAAGGLAAAVCLLMLPAAPASGQDLRLRLASAIYMDAKGAGLSAPEGIASDGESLLVVADTGNRRLLRYDLVDGRPTPTGEVRLSQLSYPTRVRIDSRGAILALDGRSHRIVRVDPAGNFGGYVELGSGGGREAVLPRSLAIDDADRLWVLDAAGGRVLVLDRSGTEQRRIDFGPQVGFLSDLAVNSAGVLYAVDSVRKRVFTARSTDTALVPLTDETEGRFTFPVALAVDRPGRIFVADQSAGHLVVLEGNGSFLTRQSARGWKEGFLRYPSALAAAAGKLFVADRGNNRVQIFTIAE